MDKDKLYRNIGVCEEVITYINENMIDSNRLVEYLELLDQLKVLTDSTYEELNLSASSGLLIPNIGAAFGNMSYAIGRIKNNKDMFKQIFKYDINESLARMKMLANCQYNIINSQENIIAERNRLVSELKKLHKEEKKDYKYKVSILVPAYNQLDYTKRTIESIFKYTDFSQGNVELITLNNGSSDGTEAYFDALPHEKKFSFKYNTLPLGISPQFYEGEYYLTVSNDVVVTPHWLDLMLECIESADDIGMVVPTCNADGITCFQGINIPYENKPGNEGEVERFALEYNSTNRKFWEERSLLMPFVIMVPSRVWALGIEDPCFVKGQFTDDNYSTLLRRSGWRMILAKNIFLHHYGSITYNRETNFAYNEALKMMRRLYLAKWGVDAWKSRGDFKIVYYLPEMDMKRKIRILWLEPLFGVSYLQVKYQLKFRGVQEIESVALIKDKRYMPDAEALFNRVLVVDELAKQLECIEERFDFIGFGDYIDKFMDWENGDILMHMKRLLSDSGRMVIPVLNYYNIRNINGWFGEIVNQYSQERARYKSILDLDRLLVDITEQCGNDACDYLAVYDSQIDINEQEVSIIKKIFSSNRDVAELKGILRTFMWWIVVRN